MLIIRASGGRFAVVCYFSGGGSEDDRMPLLGLRLKSCPSRVGVLLQGEPVVYLARRLFQRQPMGCGEPSTGLQGFALNTFAFMFLTFRSMHTATNTKATDGEGKLLFINVASGACQVEVPRVPGCVQKRHNPPRSMLSHKPRSSAVCPRAVDGTAAPPPWRQMWLASGENTRTPTM